MKDLSYQDVEDLKEMHQAAATIDRLARNLQDRVEEEMEDPQLEGWRTGEHEENRGLVDFRREIMRIHSMNRMVLESIYLSRGGKFGPPPAD
jgi:phosphate uptake regulator